MKAVIRQQWKARYKTALMLCGIISLVSLSVVLSGQGSRLFSSNSSLFQYWLSIAFAAVYFGVPVYTLTSVITTIKNMVFKDTKYLMLTVPKKSWKLIVGRLLVIMGELIAYAVVMLFWLSILFASESGGMVSFENQVYTSAAAGFFARLGEIYSIVFVKHIVETIQIIPMALIGAVFIMMVFSFSLTLFASIFRHKQFPRVLSIILVYIMFDLTVRLMALIFNGYEVDAVSSMWPPAAIIALLACGLFAGTCILFEKRIEG
ncbi:MAG: hypothetical protein KA785_07760 [Spirochaetaceae bacterium]|nr:hypothetical protein [Spirochaetaceae bacterium]